MCLGIPGEVLSVSAGDLRMGKVSFSGILKEICLEYTPEAKLGDYVIVHAGFAISCVDKAEAERVISYLSDAGLAKDEVQP